MTSTAPTASWNWREYETLFPPVAVHGSEAKVRGVAAAIKITADEILEETGYAKNGKPLSDDDPRMRDMRRAFYRLAQVGEEGQFTRRIARWSRMPASCEPILKRFVDQRLLVTNTANGETVLSVAHEALFRVWDTLNGWLHADRKALALRAQIEAAAAAWHAETRTEIHRELVWPEARIVDAVKEIAKSGVSLDDVADPKTAKTVGAFLGPTDPKDLEALPGLGAAEDATAGSVRYGDAWRLPLSHAARASVGVRLALLGDRRKGVGLRDDGLPDIDWCWIDRGQVTIEVRETPYNPSSSVVEMSGTVEGFWMARYPVTVVQFQAFLDECYRDGTWHLPAGFASPQMAPGLRFFQQGQFVTAVVFSATKHPPPKHRTRYGNHAADSVNWYDAAAYCHWLGARLGFEVRLPSEAEWQLAATGGDAARTYPWGAEWDAQVEPWRASPSESGLGQPIAIGMYPAGAAPAGVEDMTGSLWEWCRNAEFDPDNDRFPQSDVDRRVLCGGSWFGSDVPVRSRDRLRYMPNSRSLNFGFRVVCSSPSSGH